MTTILEDVREPLATALASVGASIYATAPEAIIPPACIILPGAPYFENVLIGKDKTRVKINLVIGGAVAYNNNSGALNNLEVLMISIIENMPTGYFIGDVTTPQLTAIGTANLLTSDLTVYTYYTQET
jgi:hypothetical protein